jgi:hypothetical protein
MRAVRQRPSSNERRRVWQLLGRTLASKPRLPSRGPRQGRGWQGRGWQGGGGRGGVAGGGRGGGGQGGPDLPTARLTN